MISQRPRESWQPDDASFSSQKKTNSRDRKESARKRRGAQAKERANENGVSRCFAFCLYAHLGYSTFGNERCRVDAEPLIPFDSSNCLGCTTISSIRIPGVCLCECVSVCVCVFVFCVCIVCECLFLFRHFIFTLTGEQTHLHIFKSGISVCVCLCVSLCVCRCVLSRQLALWLLKSQTISIAARRRLSAVTDVFVLFVITVLECPDMM